jgi:preprotein translocase SecE subunit
MAKTRAQRKAERRAREAQQRRQGGSAQAEKVREERAKAERDRDSDSAAQRDTQVPESGEVAEVEAIEAGIEAGVPESELELPEAPVEEIPEAPAEEEIPEAPAPARVSRSERRAQRRAQKEEERRQEEERRERQRAREQKLRQTAAEERKRGPVMGFLASCVAELRRVQWPDRETLIQASAVTILFVFISAAYLGALDALFNLLVKQIL